MSSYMFQKIFVVSARWYKTKKIKIYQASVKIWDHPRCTIKFFNDWTTGRDQHTYRSVSDVTSRASKKSLIRPCDHQGQSPTSRDKQSLFFFVGLSSKKERKNGYRASWVRSPYKKYESDFWGCAWYKARIGASHDHVAKKTAGRELCSPKCPSGIRRWTSSPIAAIRTNRSDTHPSPSLLIPSVSVWSLIIWEGREAIEYGLLSGFPLALTRWGIVTKTNCPGKKSITRSQTSVTRTLSQSHEYWQSLI